MAMLILPANPKRFDHLNAFRKNGFIHWEQRYNYDIGDIVYLYRTGPQGQIQWVCEVTKKDIPFNQSANNSNHPQTQVNFWKDPSNITAVFQQSGLNFVELKLIHTAQIGDSNLQFPRLKANGLSAVPESINRIEPSAKSEKQKKANDRQLAAYLRSYFYPSLGTTNLSIQQPTVQQPAPKPELVLPQGVDVGTCVTHCPKMAIRKCRDGKITAIDHDKKTFTVDFGDSTQDFGFSGFDKFKIR